MKLTLKDKAITLRKMGYSYNEILKQVPVAKSTLSLWLRDVGLSKEQKQTLTLKRLVAIKRGGEAKRRQRLKITQHIKEAAYKDIQNINKRELWLIGIMLYWAEGSKEKPWRSGSNVIFSNSDSVMIQVFLRWLEECIEIKTEQINIDIYIHENNQYRLNEIVKHWQQVTGFSREKFGRIYFKKHKINSKRKNLNQSYYGQLRITVRQSTNLNRKITGWIEGITHHILGSGVTVTRLSLEQRDSRFKS